MNEGSGRRPPRPRRSIGPVLVGLGVLVTSASPATAQAGREQVREGNRLYEEGRFEEAHEKYLEGLAAAPESDVILYDDGNALYQDEEYDRAAEAYRRALESDDPELRSRAWYNLGNAFYRQQRFQESLEAYKQSLRLDPEDTDAKHNLERALEQLQRQPQQNEQQQRDDRQDRPQSDQNDQQQGPSQQQDRDQQSEDQRDDQPGRQEDRQDDQESPPQNPQNEEPGDDGARDSRANPAPEPGQMTREEAERLLDAIDEDPDDVNRRRAPATGRRPRNPW